MAATTPGVELFGQRYRLRTDFSPLEIALAQASAERLERVGDDEAKAVEAFGEVLDIILRPLRSRGARASAVVTERHAQGQTSVETLTELLHAIRDLMRTTQNTGA